MTFGCESRLTEEKGIGIFATRSFEAQETVIVGAPLVPVEENSSHAVQVRRDGFAYEEGIGSLVNHSCEPNCGVRATEHGTFDLVARERIARGDEITVDYAMRNYIIEFFPEHCRCGAVCCRDRVTGWKNLSDEQRTAYATSVAPFLIEIDCEIELEQRCLAVAGGQLLRARSRAE
ncbi:MAG: SET domain-containing protein-lysine N-methyltransferase [Solirubrobacteraceae bacterium]